jgi:hypothetical protein
LTLGAPACGKAPAKQPERSAAEAKRADTASAEPAPSGDPGADAPADSPTPQGGWAIASSKNTEKDMQAAEAAALKSIEIRDLPRLREGLMARVRRALRYPESAQFRGERMNVAHTALCGEVDYEQWTDGVPGRSGYRRFIMTLDGGEVDTDFPGVHERYLDVASRIDCTPDPNY